MNVTPAAECGLRPSADAHEQRRVPEALTRGELQRVVVRSDALHGCLQEAASELASDRVERATLRGLERERLLHRERLVGEIGVRRKQGDLDPVAGQIPKRHQRLQSRDSTADDHHVVHDCRVASRQRAPEVARR